MRCVWPESGWTATPWRPVSGSTRLGDRPTSRSCATCCATTTRCWPRASRRRLRRSRRGSPCDLASASVQRPAGLPGLRRAGPCRAGAGDRRGGGPAAVPSRSRRHTALDQHLSRALRRPSRLPGGARLLRLARRADHRPAAPPRWGDRSGGTRPGDRAAAAVRCADFRRWVPLGLHRGLAAAAGARLALRDLRDQPGGRSGSRRLHELGADARTGRRRGHLRSAQPHPRPPDPPPGGGERRRLSEKLTCKNTLLQINYKLST